MDLYIYRECRVRSILCVVGLRIATGWFAIKRHHFPVEDFGEISTRSLLSNGRMILLHS